MNRAVVALSLVAVVAATSGAAHAVSDGNYDYKRHHCSGNAENSDRGPTVEKDCNTVAIVLADDTGHEYVYVGVPQTPDGTNANAIRFCLDFGQGTKNCAGMGQSGPTAPATFPGTPAHPETGLHVYFGADDNLDGGEHDGSEAIGNGPSDGGGIQLNLTPNQAMAWLAAVQSMNTSFLLTHLLPGDFGIGACADGLCLAATTQRRVAFQGFSKDRTKHRDVANYAGKVWDPDSCAGPDDKVKDCGGRTMKQWAMDEGKVYVEPGFQIFEDPDPQGSPIGPYPIPALYVGSCGLIMGGGPMLQFPASAMTNAAGQLFVDTGCK